MTSNKLTAALSFAERGWPVLPIRENDKTPLTRAGLHDASIDSAKINYWWNQWPSANVAIATGRASGLVVFDVDVKSNVDGNIAASELRLASDLIANTPSGGKHYYYQHPGRLIRNRVRLRAGLDIRADGGYVVAPPSAILAGPYEWVAQGNPPLLPSELMQLLSTNDKPESKIDNGPIMEGERNTTLFRFASDLNRKGISDEDILHLIQAKNATLCRPPLSTSEVEQLVASACKRSFNLRETRVSPSDILDMIEELNCELFTDGQDAYASMERDGHRETWELDGPDFGELIGSELYKRSKQVAPQQSTNDAISILKGRAKHEGLSLPVALRSANTRDGYLIDLADRSWQAVSVTTKGCSIVKKPEIRFRRNNQSNELFVDLNTGYGSLPELLGKQLNVRDRDLPLIVTWILDAWRPETAYPILEITGEQGASKSTTQERIRNLVDPSSAPLLTAPRNSDDIVIAARSNLVLSYNNLSGMKRDFQDLLCSVSTGGAVTGRKLYSNYAAATVTIKRPIILNGIESVGTNPDFVDRVISIELPRLLESQRRGDADLTREFRELQAQIAGGLLNLFAAALEQLPLQKLETLPRMADYAKLGEAICVIMGWSKFSDLYADNRRNAALATLDASPVARALQGFMKDRSDGFEGTVGELFTRLSEFRVDTHNWPQWERGLSSQLRRYAPVLMLAGLEVTFRDQRSNRGKIVRVVHVKSPSRPAQRAQMRSVA